MSDRADPVMRVAALMSRYDATTEDVQLIDDLRDELTFWSQCRVTRALVKAYAAGHAAGVADAARVADSYEPHCDTCPRGVVNAIKNITFQINQPKEPKEIT